MGLFDAIRNLIHPYDENDGDYISETETENAPAPVEPEAEGQPEGRFIDVSADPGARLQPQAWDGRQEEAAEPEAATKKQMVLVRPERFEDAMEITRQLRSRCTVLVNIESTPKELSCRLADFILGVVCASDCSIRKVTRCVYLIAPPNVKLGKDLNLGALMPEAAAGNPGSIK